MKLPALAGASDRRGRVPNPTTLPPALPGLFVNSSNSMTRRQAAQRSYMGHAKRYATGAVGKDLTRTERMEKANYYARKAGVALKTILKGTGVRIDNPPQGGADAATAQLALAPRSLSDVPRAIPGMIHTGFFGFTGYMSNGVFTAMMPGSFRAKVLNWFKGSDDKPRPHVERAAAAQFLFSGLSVPAGITFGAIASGIAWRFGGAGAGNFVDKSAIAFVGGQLAGFVRDGFNYGLSRKPKDRIAASFRYLARLDPPYKHGTTNVDYDAQLGPVDRFIEYDNDDKEYEAWDGDRKTKWRESMFGKSSDTKNQAADSKPANGTLGSTRELFDPAMDTPPRLELPPQMIERHNARVRAEQSRALGSSQPSSMPAMDMEPVRRPQYRTL